jgi:hypothetical protein
MTYYYRYLKAGDTATKALLDDRQELAVVKATSQSVTNSTVNVADNALTLPVAANATYHVSCVFIVFGPAAADWKYEWTFPTGATGTRFTHGPGTAVTSVRSTQIHARSAPLATVLGYGTDGSEDSLIREEMWFTTAGTAGNLALTWAQLTANASSTTLRANSFMTAYRVV